VTTNSQSIVGIVSELEGQGLMVKTHDARNATWFIKGEGIFLGYIANHRRIDRVERRKPTGPERHSSLSASNTR
jgi:hypothetical protein